MILINSFHYNIIGYYVHSNAIYDNVTLSVGG